MDSDMKNDVEKVLLAYGSGGSMMHELIEKMFVDAYGSETLRLGDDAASLPLAVADGDRLAFTTDSFVVSPHFFAGGDIGRLAVCGTVNDLATAGAQALWLSVGFILEEGYPLDELKQICSSIAAAATEAGVSIVTGDTKVVQRGHGDGIYINTSGVGIIARDVELGAAKCKSGDRILVSGSMGDHGIAIICERENLAMTVSIESDAAPLNHLVSAVLKAAPHTHCFRDPTRGGLASTLNELASSSHTQMYIDEDLVPIKDQVRGVCELLGFDALQVANEGKMVCIVPENEAEAALKAMQTSRYGQDATIIGEVLAAQNSCGDMQTNTGPQVFVRTAYGSTRILDMLVGEQLPRIC